MTEAIATPLTDAELFICDTGVWESTVVEGEFARSLERDRARLVEALAGYVQADEFANGAPPFNECPRLRRARALLASLEPKTDTKGGA